MSESTPTDPVSEHLERKVNLPFQMAKALVEMICKGFESNRVFLNKHGPIHTLHKASDSATEFTLTFCYDQSGANHFWVQPIQHVLTQPESEADCKGTASISLVSLNGGECLHVSCEHFKDRPPLITRQEGMRYSNGGDVFLSSNPTQQEDWIAFRRAACGRVFDEVAKKFAHYEALHAVGDPPYERAELVPFDELIPVLSKHFQLRGDGCFVPRASFTSPCLEVAKSNGACWLKFANGHDGPSIPLLHLLEKREFALSVDTVIREVKTRSGAVKNKRWKHSAEWLFKAQRNAQQIADAMLPDIKSFVSAINAGQDILKHAPDPREMMRAAGFVEVDAEDDSDASPVIPPQNQEPPKPVKPRPQVSKTKAEAKPVNIQPEAPIWERIPDNGKDRTIVQMLSEGKLDKEIANNIGKAEKTVSNRLSILRKDYNFIPKR